MIYVPVQANDSIQQGDIYYNLPFIRFDMENINFLNNEQEIVQGSWINEKEEMTWVLANVQKVFAIVVSEDCDCLRNPYISFAFISPWKKQCENAKAWMQEIININTKGLTSMYLPLDSQYQIEERMLIDFSTIFHLDRENIKQCSSLRLCRLNDEALNHFREKISHYFKRYSYEEYYPLNSEEMDEYLLKNATSEETFKRRLYQTNQSG